jgi:alanyl-tRNA synthetase
MVTHNSNFIDVVAGSLDAKVIAIYSDKKFIQSINAEGSGTFGVLLDKTNFYAEQGGQEYDIGSLAIDGECEFEVENVQVYGGYVLHIGYLKYGSLNVGQQVLATFDELRRWPLRNNHTSTHILNFALKSVLGDAVDQKGSLVAPEKFRFDYSSKVSHSFI